MKIKFRPFAFLFLSAALALSSCKKDPETVAEPAPDTGTLNIHFDSRRSLTEDFVVNKMYLNANQDSVSLSTFKYFISNVTLVREDGSTYAEPNSYHLIQAGNSSAKEQFLIHDVPAGNYTKIRFSVGVDAEHNSSTATQVGDLGADHDMTWDWNTGYMFVFTMGKYYKAGAANPYPDFMYTIGKNQHYRTVELAFPSGHELTRIDKANNPKMHLHANILDIFGAQNGTGKVDVKANPFVAGDPQHNTVAEKIADNYASMFRIDHIHAH